MDFWSMSMEMNLGLLVDATRPLLIRSRILGRSWNRVIQALFFSFLFFSLPSAGGSPIDFWSMSMEIILRPCHSPLFFSWPAAGGSLVDFLSMSTEMNLRLLVMLFVSFLSPPLSISYGFLIDVHGFDSRILVSGWNRVIQALVGFLRWHQGLSVSWLSKTLL